ncbi:MAG: hypothetical protein JRC57_05180 [Deltaproteobacteria bacterium]|jgi:hypothetical protein|nr:hypothetical protein [Deltaproteobacteria bacterium]MBW2652461.1 hypothetical protein [Deltaproteobacteria bacterium]
MKRIIVALSLILAVLTMTSCGSLRSSPHMGFQGVSIEANMGRDDFIILDRVEGESDTTSIFFGIVQIIDGGKLKLFWIPFYEVKYAYPVTGLWGGSQMMFATEKRAYYKALAETPDADCILYKSYTIEKSGVPLIFTKKNVIFSGKALKLKAD